MRIRQLDAADSEARAHPTRASTLVQTYLSERLRFATEYAGHSAALEEAARTQLRQVEEALMQGKALLTSCQLNARRAREDARLLVERYHRLFE